VTQLLDFGSIGTVDAVLDDLVGNNLAAIAPDVDKDSVSFSTELISQHIVNGNTLKVRVSRVAHFGVPAKAPGIPADSAVVPTGAGIDLATQIVFTDVYQRASLIEKLRMSARNEKAGGGDVVHTGNAASKAGASTFGGINGVFQKLREVDFEQFVYPPTPEPTQEPSVRPSARPTVTASSAPSSSPTPLHSSSPSSMPSVSPSDVPTTTPSFAPTYSPTKERRDDCKVEMYYEKSWCWHDDARNSDCKENYQFCIDKSGDELLMEDCGGAEFKVIGFTVRPKSDSKRCWTRRGDAGIRLDDCDEKGDGKWKDQQWDGVCSKKPHMITPLGDKKWCLTQGHEPRNGERLKLQECDK